LHDSCCLPIGSRPLCLAEPRLLRSNLSPAARRSSHRQSSPCAALLNWFLWGTSHTEDDSSPKIGAGRQSSLAADSLLNPSRPRGRSWGNIATGVNHRNGAQSLPSYPGSGVPRAQEGSGARNSQLRMCVSLKMAASGNVCLGINSHREVVCCFLSFHHQSISLSTVIYLVLQRVITVLVLYRQSTSFNNTETNHSKRLLCPAYNQNQLHRRQPTSTARPIQDTTNQATGFQTPHTTAPPTSNVFQRILQRLLCPGQGCLHISSHHIFHKYVA